jgi:hypothetical protein
MPDFLGQWLPHCDDPHIHNFYIASVLMLLKPWREARDIHQENLSWEESFTAFISKASPAMEHLLDNFQFYYACENVAAKKTLTNETWRNPEEENMNLLEDKVYSMQYTEQSPEDVQQIANNIVPTQELLHGRQAVDIGV